MKREITTVLAIGLIALSKAQSSIIIIKTTGTAANAILPIIATILLAVAALLIWNRKRLGVIIATPIIGLYLLQFFLLGIVQKMFIYFFMHAFAIGVSIISWRNFKNQSNEKSEPVAQH